MCSENWWPPCGTAARDDSVRAQHVLDPQYSVSP